MVLTLSLLTHADAAEVEREYKIKLNTMDEIKELDCIVLAVAHKEFAELGLDKINTFFREMPNDEKVIIDIKNLCKIEELHTKGYRFWRL